MREVFRSIKEVKTGDYRPSEYTRDASLDKVRVGFASTSPASQRRGFLPFPVKGAKHPDFPGFTPQFFCKI
jgi:hypothetical protein